MVSIKQLITYIVEEFDCIVMGEYESTRDIYQVDILSPNQILDRNILYLVPMDMQPPPSPYMSLLPISRLNIPAYPSLIVTNKELPLQRLLTELQERIKLESRLTSHINQTFHALYSGHGLTDVVKKAEEFIGSPISVLDNSYRLIAASPLMKQLSYGIKENSGSLILGSEEIASLKRLQIEDQIYEKNRAFSIHSPDHPDETWIFCAIRIQNIVTGYVAICLSTAREATEYELRMAASLSDICAIEMQKHDFFVTRTGLKYEHFLIDLIEGRFNDVNMISSRLELLDREFYHYYCLVVLECTEPHDSNIFNNRQMSTLRNIYPNSMSVVYQDSIILFLNQKQPISLKEEFIKPLETYAMRNHLKASFSQPFVDILKIRTFYLQAVTNLHMGISAFPNQTLYFSSDMISHFLYTKCNYQELEAGVHYHISQLQDYDEEYHTEFITTLRAYLEHDRNMAQAAEALNIHRSTFFYRIKKIEELLDISITDSHLLFLYEISFQIWDYLSH